VPYCPICKAEYRMEFNDCSVCFAELVTTREQAEAVRVVVLWEGTNLSKFDAIVKILRERDVPNRTKRGTEVKKDYVLFDNLISRIVHFRKRMSWQVVVLEADYQRAQTAAHSYL
jgi:uncharacterized Zn ribbon protein